MRVLVTGANGFFGRVTCRVLFDHGHTPVLMTNDVDMTNRRAVWDWLAVNLDPAPIDAAVHLAVRDDAARSWKDPAGSWAFNIGGTANLISGLRFVGQTVPLVVASTTAIYSSSETGPVAENAEFDANDPYEASMVAMEDLLNYEASNVDSMALRFATIAGGWQRIADEHRTNIVTQALAVALGEEPKLIVRGDGTNLCEFVHVRDAAQAIRLAVEAPRKNDILNVGSGVGVSAMSVVESARAFTGHPIPVEFEATADVPDMAVADSSAFRRKFRWKPELAGIEKIVGDAWAAMKAGD